MVKLKDVEEFRWEEQHQATFDKIKKYLSKPPILMPLKLIAANESIGCLLVQNNSKGHEQAIYYLSRVFNPTETRYNPIEILCLALYFACTKLKHYLIKSQVYVVSHNDLMKFNQPLITRRIGKWSLA